MIPFHRKPLQKQADRREMCLNQLTYNRCISQKQQFFDGRDGIAVV